MEVIIDGVKGFTFTKPYNRSSLPIKIMGLFKEKNIGYV
jgi:hypothetical protein